MKSRMHLTWERPEIVDQSFQVVGSNILIFQSLSFLTVKQGEMPYFLWIVCRINEIIPVPGSINTDYNYLRRSLDYVLLNNIIYYWAICEESY